MVDRPRKPTINIESKPANQQQTVEVSSDQNHVVATLASGDVVDILLHGATVTSWKTKGRENLFLSDKAILDGSKPVRGGVPIVFPVFGPPAADHATGKLPQHGFARISKWEFLGKSSSESGPLAKGGDDSVKLDFGLSQSNLSDDSRKAWPFQFSLIYSVTLGNNRLQTMLNVRNEGEKTFEFQTLFHTYFRIKDISQVTINGLLGTTYVDKVLNATSHTESNSALPVTGEMDRVYKSIAQDTTSIVEAGIPRLDVVRDNMSDTVVWNPWKTKAASMSDFGPADGWKEMVCVEVGAVDGWQKLDAGETFEGGQIFKALL